MDSTFTKTITLPQLLNNLRLGVGDSPQNVFEKFPIREIREQCLKRLESQKMNIHLAGWLEKQALGLLQKNDYFAKDVLSFYLFNTKNDDESDCDVGPIRAIKYLVDLNTKASEGTPFSLYECSKLIVGRLFDRTDPAIEYYGKMKDFLPKFFSVCLNCIYTNRGDGYSEKDWNCTSRALRVFVEAKDFTFLQTIDELGISLKTGLIKPSSDMPIFSKSMHHAALIEARDILKVEKYQVDIKNNPDNDDDIPF